MFFKAGILAYLEELRDARLSELMIGLQATGRWFSACKEKKRRKQQMAGLLILQRNIRAWATLRTWEWYKVLQNVKPLLKNAEKEEEERQKELARQKVNSLLADPDLIHL